MDGCLPPSCKERKEEECRSGSLSRVCTLRSSKSYLLFWHLTQRARKNAIPRRWKSVSAHGIATSTRLSTRLLMTRHAKKASNLDPVNRKSLDRLGQAHTFVHLPSSVECTDELEEPGSKTGNARHPSHASQLLGICPSAVGSTSTASFHRETPG
ncbi:hypothetical protein LY78DRAFT_274107 [Colletotrichum sublineola]|nr:hypothetical protein LY78DRAFT_274107 [Colletotrichum sublineola]